jgi:hypothetical protein
MVKVKGSTELKSVDLNYRRSCSCAHVKILLDVPAGKPMWYERNGDNIYVHIHDVTSIEGSSFKPGKVPVQRTQVIE